MISENIDVKSTLSAFYRVADFCCWHKNHSPTKLAAAISVEAAELLREFQWADADSALSEEKKKRVGGELADVLMYVLVLSDKLDLEISTALEEKITENYARFIETRE